MSWQSQKEEDQAFNSMSKSQKRTYSDHHDDNGGDVRQALDDTIGPVWFPADQKDNPRNGR
ncbi:hypothetical protein ACFL2U_00685 [Patescibacteria group bacterium]